MADNNNWIIGQGESLMTPVTLVTGFGEKAHPYEFDEASERLSSEIDFSIDAINQLPDLACPEDESVIAVTLHPSYLAKTYHPTRMIRALGLRQVGSRERRILPEAFTTQRAPTNPIVAPELFLAGPRKKLERLKPSSEIWSTDEVLRDDFRKMETVRPLGVDRIKVQSEFSGFIPLEIALHLGREPGRNSIDVVGGFENWIRSLWHDAEIKRQNIVGGLAFLGLSADAKLVHEIAQYSFLRVVRRMPRLSTREISVAHQELVGNHPDLDNCAPVSNAVRLAILDGGLASDHPFDVAVSALEPLGIGAAADGGFEHGAKVTSAALFGSLQTVGDPPAPFCPIDHWRVLDEDDGDFELMDVLDRVISILSQSQYDYVNISVGPDEKMLDDDIHVWTAKLDEYAATGRSLILAAAGNRGDEAPGDNRIQPPGDGVNLIAIGACDSKSSTWARAPYSGVGPGRSPGLIKPDIVAFGGTEENPFICIDENGETVAVKGTSFAAPVAARAASCLGATFGQQLSPMAVKALLIHHAEDDNNEQLEVGWGRIPPDLMSLMTCANDEATVVYQGILPQARAMRFPLPFPVGGFSKSVAVSATFVVATPTDPEDAINYTQTGVGITFRPDTTGHPGFNSDGKAKRHHQTASFFGNSKVFKTEQELREDAYRWEAVRRVTNRKFRATTLNDPVFDVQYSARRNGHAAEKLDSIPYALIITVRENGNQDLYNEIIRTYGGVIRALTPQIQVTL